MSDIFNEKYNEYLSKFNNHLSDTLLGLEYSAPSILLEGMRYAVSDGGKRIRPILCIATADMLGVDYEDIKELALAVELIHSYSLVHDDLPAMDNDDYRRGKFSTHKKFGEANGILIGDALLNYSFEQVLSKEQIFLKHIKALALLSKSAGYTGMIKGQVLDLQMEGSIDCNQEKLYEIIENKTAKLIIAPVLISSIMADNLYYKELEEFALNLGILFQITDDIMDEEGTLHSIGKTPHKDAEVDKLSSIKVFGLEGAKKRLHYHYDKCLTALGKIPNNEFLLEFTKKIYSRKK